MTLLLFVGGWLLAAAFTAALFAALARANRQEPEGPVTPVLLPEPRSAPIEVRRLESQR